MGGSVLIIKHLNLSPHRLNCVYLTPPFSFFYSAIFFPPRAHSQILICLNFPNVHNTKNLTVSGPAHPGPQSLDRAPTHSSMRRPTIPQVARPF